jgi:rRNA-processing protein EBP2
MGKLKESLRKLRKQIEDEDNAETNVNGVASEVAAEQSKPLSRKERRKALREMRPKESKKEADQEDDDNESEEETSKVDLARLQESESESDLEVDEDGDEEDGEHDEEDDEDVPLSDAEFDDDADVVPFQKTTVNNTKALQEARSRIGLPIEKLSFYDHMSITSEAPIELKDVYDDLERELAFYKQGLAAAKVAKKLLKKENVPFTRPTDYFAEMVKSDEHMDKLKQKLIDDETAKRHAQDARRQRELKKFGKKVQHERLQERHKEKRETLDKIKSLKRKRADNALTTDDFDVAVDEAVEDKKEKRKEKYGPNARRQAKNKRYGFGGRKKFKKENDAASSADMSGFSSKKMKAGAKTRPGKSKRAAGRR